MPKSSEYREVWSTEVGAICNGCRKAISKCSCAEDRKKQSLGDGSVKYRRETKGRGGKTVTTIAGLALSTTEAEKLLKDLKRICGTGGAIKDGVLELQGDRCDVVGAELAKRGIKAKRAGG